MKKRWLVLILILMSIINLSAFSMWAYNICCDRRRVACCEKVDVTAFMQKRLGLSAQQIAEMKQVLDQQQAVQAQLAWHMQQRRLELSQALISSIPDSVRIEKILVELDQLQANMQRQVVKNLLAQKKFLTASQQETFFSMIARQCSMEMQEQSNCSMKNTQ